MMIISFAWTSEAFKAGRKTKTRREWTEDYANRFKIGDICKAYDRQPRFGGKQIGELIVESLTYEDIRLMPDSDYELEGFAYLEEQGLKIWNKHPREAFEDWRNEGGFYWVLHFTPIIEKVS